MNTEETHLEKYLEMFPEKEMDIQKYFAKMNYYIGLTGIGTSLLDIEPEYNLPAIPLMVEFEILNSSKIEALNRWYIWCNAMMNIGENLSMNDWKCPKMIDEILKDRIESIDSIIEQKKILNSKLLFEVDAMGKIADSNPFLFLWDCLFGKKYQAHKETYNNLSEIYNEIDLLLNGYHK